MMRDRRGQSKIDSATSLGLGRRDHPIHLVALGSGLRGGRKRQNQRPASARSSPVCIRDEIETQKLSARNGKPVESVPFSQAVLRLPALKNHDSVLPYHTFGPEKSR